MNCKDVHRYVHAFIDGELDTQQTLEVERHLESCAECAHAVDFERWFKGELRRSVGSVLAPPALADRVRGAMARADRADRARVLLPRAGAATALAAGVVAALFLPGWLTPAPEASRDPSMPRPVIDYVAEQHVHTLPTEVPGPDAASVAAWYQDKLDFAVNPPYFTAGDVRLVGGRISNVGDRRAAQLLYHLQGRRITVVVFDGQGVPIQGASPLQAGPRTIYVGESHGYPVAVWHQGGVAYAASSDLPRGDFVRLVASAQ